MARVEQQACYVLHHKPYRETSLILDVLTQDFGRIGLIAKGAKRPKSPFRGRLQPFVCNIVNWSGKGQLKTLTNIDTVSFFSLEGMSSYCGFYLNELVMRLTHPEDHHEGLFTEYHDAVVSLAASNACEPSLRIFEKQLLQQLGYGLQLTHTSDTGLPLDSAQWYYYVVNQGPLAFPSEHGVKIQGGALLALAQEKMENVQHLQQCKRLMRYVLDSYLGTEPLNSRALFQQFQPSRR